MRPRSKILSKRRLLLPTIREGTEEMVRDLNEANTLHTSSGHCHPLSSEDYLLSICHLAHPTFPCGDASSNNINARQPDAVHQRLRPSRLSESTSATFKEARTDNVQERESRQLGGDLFGYHGNSDPLEYLYGHQSNSALSPCLSGSARRTFVERRIMRQNGGVVEGQARSRAHSVPYTPGPDHPCQRKGSCPELHTSTHTTYEDVSTKRCLSKPEAERGSTVDRGSEGERHIPTIKHSLISQWISDCRSAWRQARVRACLLPAIAEI
ncbi:uncharacterized protein LOC143011954 [Genypterus blacodes]|uniref:uncharacterized protein LOC143011954 n=1 Tax=Genypterus blacodes TaxID=154954 RepID=UPI003F776467